MDERPAHDTARGQAGRITRAQLTDQGWSERQVDCRLAAGRLVRRDAGVYAFPPALPSPEAASWEAVLAVGGEVVGLSHAWGAWQRGLVARPVPPVDVSTRAQSRRTFRGVRVHRRTTLRAGDVSLVDGLPVCSVALCLLDLAHRHPRLLPRALNRAQHLMLDVGDLRAFAAGRPGCRVLLTAMDAYDPREERTREELERLALRMLVERGAPVYEPNALVEACGRTYEVDGLYRAERLVVELQSEAHHSTPAERRQDRVRANALGAACFGLLHWDWGDVTRRPDATVAQLRTRLGTGA